MVDGTHTSFEQEFRSAYLSLNPYLVVADELSSALLEYRGELTSQEALRAISTVVSKNRRVLEFFEELQKHERRGFNLPYEHELTGSNVDFGMADNAYQLLDLGLRLLRTENPKEVITDARYAPRF